MFRCMLRASEVCQPRSNIYWERDMLMYPLPLPIPLPQVRRNSKGEVKFVAISSSTPIMLAKVMNLGHMTTIYPSSPAPL
jgi:hypothetical protein